MLLNPSPFTTSLPAVQIYSTWGHFSHFHLNMVFLSFSPHLSFQRNLVETPGDRTGKQRTRGVRQKSGLRECGWEGNDMGLLIYSLGLKISPEVSHGVLECAIVMLQNYMLMIL